MRATIKDDDFIHLYPAIIEQRIPMKRLPFNSCKSIFPRVALLFWIRSSLHLDGESNFSIRRLIANRKQPTTMERKPSKAFRQIARTILRVSIELNSGSVFSSWSRYFFFYYFQSDFNTGQVDVKFNVIRSTRLPLIVCHGLRFIWTNMLAFRLEISSFGYQYPNLSLAAFCNIFSGWDYLVSNRTCSNGRSSIVWNFLKKKKNPRQISS